MKRLCFALLLIFSTVLAPPAHAAPSTNGGDVYSLTAKANGVTYFAGYDRTLSPGAGWTDGDRLGYVCAWGFLELDGAFVGQVGFTRLPQAAYVVVNDAGMAEGNDGPDSNPHPYAWGGEPAPVRPAKSVPKIEDCPSSGHAETYVPATGPIGPAPVITFSVGERVLEVRDYTSALFRQVGSGPRWQFEIVEASAANVTVIGYQNNQPELAIYYQPLGAGEMTSNGVA